MSKMKILLLALYCDGMWGIHEEIGICYIAAYLREHGYEVMLKGMDVNSINYAEFKDFAPDIIGMPAYDINKEWVYRSCKEMRKLLPKAVICVGGSLPTCHRKEVLKECREIDLTIRGEGELTFLEMVLKLEKGQGLDEIKGITYRKGSEIIENDMRPLIDDLNALPFPARDILLQNNIKIAQISTSRGCTAKCSFCASQLYWKRWRGRSIDNVVDEIHHIVNIYGIKAFNIIDGSFEDPGNNIERIKGIAENILSRGLQISYYVQIRAEFYKQASQELVDILKKSGLSSVCIGIESANEEDLKLYKKNAGLDDMGKAIEFFRDNDINVDPGFINFNPYSTLTKLRKNIDFLEKYGFAANPDYIIKCSKIYKGTTLFRKVEEDNLINDTSCFECYFRFADEKVKQVYEYTYSYLKGADPASTTVFRGICHGSSFNYVGIACMKTLFLNHSLTNAYKIVREYELHCRNTSATANKKIAEWFRGILSIADQGWNNMLADETSEKLLPKEYLKDIALSFHYQNEKLKIKLSELIMDEPFKDLLRFML